MKTGTRMGAAALVLAAGACGAIATPGDTLVISLNSGGVLGNLPSVAPTISGDGVLVAFQSSATKALWDASVVRTK